MQVQHSETNANAESSDVKGFIIVLAQLAGIAIVIDRYQIESPAFSSLVQLAVGGFAIHYFLPFRFRLPFFLALSLTGIIWVLGLEAGFAVVAIGLALIGIVHLPWKISINVGLLLIVGAALTAIRAGLIGNVDSWAFWPILGSMFMFRLIGYVYDVSHGQGQATIWQRLSYFFLLPNVCFPLFPVVDFRTFVRTYYNAPRHEIYQVGVDWIIRGVIQLLLYRFIHRWLVITPEEVVNAGDLIHYFLWLYLLYLRVSGTFHIAVGILRLFGFGLPETHHRYYLASSITDFWRRINIYWKDFMMKIFYYPIFFRLKGLGTTGAMVVSTIAVFVLTWALHAYQWFWIRKSLLLTWTDSLFWTILCVLVVINSLWEARRGRKRTLGGRVQTWRDRVPVAIQTAGTFALICTLWSFWSSASVGTWLALWTAAVKPPTASQCMVFAGLIAVFLYYTVVEEGLFKLPAAAKLRSDWGREAGGLAWVAALILISFSLVYGKLGQAGQVIASLQYSGLNRAELEELERGYYEDLLSVDRFNTALSDLYSKRPPDWAGIHQADITKPGDDGLRYEMLPDAVSKMRGAPIKTNRWGQRDQDYPLERVPGAYRIALLGSSHVMGSGVEKNDSFEAIIEERLNAEKVGSPYAKYELINCAIGGFVPYEQVAFLRARVLRFKPDAIVLVGHTGDLNRFSNILKAIADGEAARYSFLSDILERASVDPDELRHVNLQRLRPYREEFLGRVYSTVVQICRENNIKPIYVFMPLIPDVPGPKRVQQNPPEVAIAKEAGFLTLDLSGVYDAHERRELWVAEWDDHPNELGHRLVAERLYRLFQKNWDEIFAREVGGS